MSFAFVMFLLLINVFFLIKTIENHKTEYGKISIIVLLFLVHLIATYYFYEINFQKQQDSYIFYERALNSNNILQFAYPGSKFISFLIYPLVKIGLSYFSISALFSTFSLVGFILFINELFNKTKNLTSNKFLFFLALMALTPTLHFWTSGLTKEAIIFFLLVVVLKIVLYSKTINYLIFFPLLLILAIRPYLFFIMILTYTIHSIINYKLSIKKKGMLIISFIIISLLALPIIKIFLKVKTLNYQTYTLFLKKITKYSNNSGSSSINLEASNYFDRFILVTSRPLFFDSKTFFQYIVSIENTCFIVLITIFLYKYITRKIKLDKSFFFIYATSTLIILFLSLYMYNLGLASRMRIMYMPYLIFIMFISEVKIFEHEKKNN